MITFGGCRRRKPLDSFSLLGLCRESEDTWSVVWKHSPQVGSCQCCGNGEHTTGRILAERRGQGFDLAQIQVVQIRDAIACFATPVAGGALRMTRGARLYDNCTMTVGNVEF